MAVSSLVWQKLQSQEVEKPPVTLKFTHPEFMDVNKKYPNKRYPVQKIILLKKFRNKIFTTQKKFHFGIFFAKDIFKRRIFFKLGYFPVGFFCYIFSEKPRCEQRLDSFYVLWTHFILKFQPLTLDFIHKSP